MHIMNREGLLIGSFRIIAMRDVKNIVTNIFLYDKPWTTTKAHALSLANGMKPQAFMLSDASSRLEFNHFSRLFTKVTTDIIFPKKQMP